MTTVCCGTHAVYAAGMASETKPDESLAERVERLERLARVQLWTIGVLTANLFLMTILQML